MSVSNTIDIDGRRLTLTNLDKVLWPETGFTKAEMIDYYARVAGWLLPHLERRPITLRRFPNGVDGVNWYQTRCLNRPSWLPVAPIAARSGELQEYCLIDDLASLIWVANQASVELHPFLARVPELNQPTAVVFDLDPGAPASLVECCQLALLLREVLDASALASFAKTSGTLGLHIYVPLNTPHSYEKTKRFARTIAQLLTREYPDLVVHQQKRSLRAGKVLIDWLQNDPTRSTVAPYSLRAAPWPLVSTPIRWDEIAHVAAAREADSLFFAVSAALERLERLGDIFQPALELEQTLPEPA
jgi:bifunctional non-homologous end joining protein LigD